jgi:Fe2+ transport system protein B
MSGSEAVAAYMTEYAARDIQEEEVKKEFEVEYRDEHGQPTLIGIVECVKGTKLKIADDARIPRKRFFERQALKRKDQNHLETLFTLPARLTDSQNLRKERETALRKEIERLRKQNEEEDKIIEDGAISDQMEKRRKLPGEVRGLLAEDDERVKEVLLLPQAFENLRKSGPERAELALETEMEKLLKQQKEEEKKKKENSASSTTAAQPCKKTHPPSKRESYVAQKWLLHLRIALCVFSFLMALFPTFRLSIQELIANPVIGYVTSAILCEVSTVGEKFAEKLPLTSTITVSLYNFFGFWVFTAGVIWLYFQLVEIAQFVGVSSRAVIQNTAKSKKA